MQVKEEEVNQARVGMAAISKSGAEICFKTKMRLHNCQKKTTTHSISCISPVVEGQYELIELGSNEVATFILESLFPDEGSSESLGRHCLFVSRKPAKVKRLKTVYISSQNFIDN